MTITRVEGVRVGHWTDPVGLTGCTVVVFPEPNVAAVEVRGAAPGTRETALLQPGMLVEQIQAIVLSGGSAFGLATADGVMRMLEADARGHPTVGGPVPIVPAAVVYDLAEGDASARPGAEAGAHAYADADSRPVELGRVGAGTGCTVGKWRGARIPGGLGSAAVIGDGFTVGALAVVNAVGDVFTLEGEPLSGGSIVPGSPQAAPAVGENTTLVVVASDARIGRAELTRVAVRAQDALAVTLRPAHTRYDGDTCFAVSCGRRDVSVDAVAEAAFEAVGRAVESAMGAGRSPVG